MRLTDRLADQGRRLFLFRAIVPLATLPLAMLALPQSRAMESWLGATGNLIYQWAAISVGLFGLALRCAAVAYAPDGSSSRDTQQIRATALNTTGIYSIVRHPLYCGAGLLWIGAALTLRVWWFAALVALLYIVYIERIVVAEEAYLSATFDEFDPWSSRTPAFVPKPSLWRPAGGTLQWRRLLSEHNALLALAASVALLEFLEDALDGVVTWAEWRAIHPDLVWLVACAAAISIVAITLRRWGLEASSEVQGSEC
jgi:protein-S-isoprenylcysteine O-methyltransferase Ste14